MPAMGQHIMSDTGINDGTFCLFLLPVSDRLSSFYLQYKLVQCNVNAGGLQGRI